MTRTITQAELRNGSAGVMDALELGHHFVITRRGTPVGELRPVGRRREVTREELIRAFSGLSRGSNSAQIRAEIDACFGEDRIDDE
ncbi:MAG: type II toxin-antitoxin system Phd/YefM family antitoxin [Candidatus Dormibacteraceae bacterium]